MEIVLFIWKILYLENTNIFELFLHSNLIISRQHAFLEVSTKDCGDGRIFVSPFVLSIDNPWKVVGVHAKVF